MKTKTKKATIPHDVARTIAEAAVRGGKPAIVIVDPSPGRRAHTRRAAARAVISVKNLRVRVMERASRPLAVEDFEGGFLPGTLLDTDRSEVIFKRIVEELTK